MWLSGLFDQKEAEVPGYHIQQVVTWIQLVWCALCLHCMLSGQQSYSCILGTHDKPWGHHIVMGGGNRDSYHVQKKLSFILISKTQWYWLQAGKIHISGGWWKGVGWGPSGQSPRKNSGLPRCGNSLQFSIKKRWGEKKEMTRSWKWL